MRSLPNCINGCWTSPLRSPDGPCSHSRERARPRLQASGMGSWRALVQRKVEENGPARGPASCSLRWEGGVHVGGHDPEGNGSVAKVTRSQPVLTPLTEAAIFLVLTVDSGGEDVVRDLLADSAGIVRSVGFRDPDGELACVFAIGSDAWDTLFAGPRPAEL